MYCGANVVPHLLGVDDHAVEVEDDGVDHSARYPRCDVRRATSAAVPSSTGRSSPTKSVWSPVRDLVDRPRGQPAGGAGQQARIVLAHVDPVPERDRRHAAREVLRELLLLAREDRGRPRAGVAQQLVQRRALARSRSRSERGSSESETSDETVSPARRPSTSATTTETPAGHCRKSERCSAPISCTGPSLVDTLREVGQLARHCLSPSWVIASFASASAALSYGPGASPCHITSGVTPGPSTVARYFVPAPALCEPCGLNE